MKKTNLSSNALSKITRLLSMGLDFIDERKEKAQDDELFLLTSYQNYFSVLNNRILMKSFDEEKFHDTIFEFESALFNWYESLPYAIGSDDSNDLYNILFAILQGIDKIIDEDLV